MTLLTNAVESIQVGVADWREGSRPRLLSAVRNVHAGILLLYKEALLRLSPAGSSEVLIKAKQVPIKDATGQIQYKGIGRKTVNAHQIRERFEGLGIKTDWKRLGQIAEVRNDIEHYFADATQDSVRGVIARAFLIIRDFCVYQLAEDPRDLLGQDTWQAMLEASELYAAERKMCDDAISAQEWISSTLEEAIAGIRCGSCSSDLLIPSERGEYSEVVLVCRLCGQQQAPEEYVPAAVSEAFEWETYVAMTDGGDPPVAECPNCTAETYIIEEGQCALCGEGVEHECLMCGGAIPPSELGSAPLCAYCDHLMSKDD